MTTTQQTSDNTGLDLPPLAGRYVDVEKIPWKPTPTPGIDMKILMRDPETGLMTAMFRWAPGTSLPLHEHVEIEQSFVLEGSLEDDEGIVTAGNYAWRPKGNRHAPWSTEGCLLVAFFLKPNVFLEGPAEGQELI